MSSKNSGNRKKKRRRIKNRGAENKKRGKKGGKIVGDKCWKREERGEKERKEESQEVENCAVQFKFSQLFLQCVRNTIRFKRGSLHNVESGPPCSRICRIRDALEYRFELPFNATFSPIYSSPPRNQVHFTGQDSPDFSRRSHSSFSSFVLLSSPILFIFFRLGSLSNERTYLTFILGTRDHFCPHSWGHGSMNLWGGWL